MNTQIYDSLFRTHYGYIRAVVHRSGIPPQEIEDVACDILLKIIEQDGMGKFDPDRDVKIRTYIGNYVSLSSRSYLTSHLKYNSRNLLQGDFSVDLVESEINYKDTGLYDRIAEHLDGDALTFLTYASQSKDYTAARKCLSDLGWEKKRITASVLKVRKTARQCISL